MVVLASPAAKAPSGELKVSGTVTVNGESVISGGTVFSDSVITTADNSMATVNLSKLGRVELSPNSSLRISFTEKGITGLLDSGSAHVSTLGGVTVNFTTKDGAVVVDGSQATSFTVSISKGITSLATQSGLAVLRSGGNSKQVAAGESATAGTPNPKNDPGDADDKMSSGELAAFLLAGGAAAALIFYAITHNNDLNFGGTVSVISPAR